MKEFIIDNKLLINEWDWKKNTNLNPQSLTCGTDKRAWWKCVKGHEWQASINSRAKGAGCPFCAGQRAIEGENDLFTCNPDLVVEWNYDKNFDISPQSVMPNSGKKVWWTCKVCKFEWMATIASRNNGTGCPKCYERNQTSFPEQVIYFYLKKFFSDAINRYRSPKLNNKEIDIFIPSIKIGIEYDGEIWHKSEKALKKEIAKYRVCNDNNIKLIRIKEKLYSSNEKVCDFLITTETKYDNSSFQKIFDELKNILNIDVQVDLQKDELEIKSYFIRDLKENSLGEKFPHLIKEWNYLKNENLTPFSFRANTHDKVWWKCEKGHEWQASISNRVKGTSCPYCSGKSVLTGVNDLQSTNPILAREWNYDKNIDTLPTMFSNGSHKKVWWKCYKGHEWQAIIYNRFKGSGCPICRATKLSKEFSKPKNGNSLLDTYPELSKEWHPTKNGDLTPSNVSKRSGMKVWWKCEKGHEWQTYIYYRSHNGSGCPYCKKHIKDKK